MRAPGIPDEEFIRDPEIPITREEVRVIVLSKLKVRPGDVVLDVGCGTGSVSVEAALMGARVYAMDKNPKAVELTRRNAEKFGVLDRIRVVLGEAPRDLPRHTRFTSAFIGGGGRGLPKIVPEVARLVEPGGRIVLSVTALESLAALIPALEELDYEVVLVQVARGKRAGGYTLLSPLSPVYVVTVRLRETRKNST
ncbi:MAG: precorrin-6Y C5,15-methyltransferase (decarboxylating) subunit CbiT [Thermoproteaceae archaeon]|jgi:cobalt-precorrin-6B (C15)-methyltransferase|nr:precorrin-6Y C5,15-methyltransferase (decarboxylating) subunit CbiT [Thermoproteaceae archaeon]